MSGEAGRASIFEFPETSENGREFFSGSRPLWGGYALFGMRHQHVAEDSLLGRSRESIRAEQGNFDPNRELPRQWPAPRLVRGGGAPHTRPARRDGQRGWRRKVK